jgi:DNA-binding GntR family transcriptional regulator
LPAASSKPLSLIGAPPRTGRPRSRPGDDLIYQELLAAIIDHRIPPGTALPEDTLAGAFGVSRTVVRKSLIRLAHDKVIELRRNRGAVVARPSVEEARQVFAARRLIEAALLREAVARLSERELELLRGQTAEERAAFAAGDRRTVIRLSGEFHRRLAAAAGNQVLAEFVGELVSRTSLVIALYEVPGIAPCSLDEHGALLDTIRRRDADAAVRLMLDHLDHCEAQLDLSGAGGAVDLVSLFAHLRPPPRKAS